MQVAGLVTVPGGSWGGDLVLLKLSGVRLQVAGLVATPGVSWGGDQVLLELSGGRTCYNTRRKLGWQPSCVKAAGDCGAGCRTCYSTWRKLG